MRPVVVRLFLTSAALLFVELLLIRWIPANVAYVGFFNNFVLMASFLGIGLGILVGRRWSASTMAVFAVSLLALAVLVRSARVDAPANELFLGSGARAALSIDLGVVALTLVLVTLTMAALATPLARLLRSLPPLRAYATDIAGSLAGIALFAATSAAGTGPVVWFAIALVLGVTLELLQGPDRRSLIGAAALAGTVGLALVGSDIWSPYYRITTFELPRGAVGLAVNGIPHQRMSPLDEIQTPIYLQVYKWWPERRFERALIVGAGSGTDVAIALDHGVASIDAVEIDPAILELGRLRHPERPYADPRVRAVVEDGRAFLRSSGDRYDLIVFAETDSLTLVTSTANIRLESFLFTEEAFASARDHLTPDGIFVMYNWYREPWLVARYVAMLERTFGAPPVVLTSRDFDVSEAVIAAGPGVRAARSGEVSPIDVADAPPGTHDDRPFPYLRAAEIPATSLAALVALIACAAIAIGATARVTRLPLRRFSLHFFLLGAAFLLVETRSLVTFSLLFGTTWIVNALVFFAVLASILVAIGVSVAWPRRDPRPFYVALFTWLAVGYALPPSELLLEPAVLRYAVASVIAFGPVFFANLIFAHSFRDTEAADVAFASNLLGAMAGGVLEWSAIVVGYRALALVIAALYLLARFAQRRSTIAEPSAAPEVARA